VSRTGGKVAEVVGRRRVVEVMSFVCRGDASTRNRGSWGWKLLRRCKAKPGVSYIGPKAVEYNSL
jgi:hypothetical protein